MEIHTYNGLRHTEAKNVGYDFQGKKRSIDLAVRHIDNLGSTTTCFFTKKLLVHEPSQKGGFPHILGVHCINLVENLNFG